MSGPFPLSSLREVSLSCPIFALQIQSLSSHEITFKDMKFILLHDAKNDDGVRAFFADLWELYIKVTSPSVCAFPPRH